DVEQALAEKFPQTGLERQRSAARAVAVADMGLRAAIRSCGGRRLAARRWDGRRPRAARHQAGNISRPLPAGHAIGPYQRIRGDRVSGDEVAKLSFRKRALLLALGGIKPGSIGHFIPLIASRAALPAGA